MTTIGLLIQTQTDAYLVMGSCNLGCIAESRKGRRHARHLQCACLYEFVQKLHAVDDHVSDIS